VSNDGPNKQLRTDGTGRFSKSKCADTVTLQTRSGHSIIIGLHFAFANALRHCRGKGATKLARGLSTDDGDLASRGGL
jgi:hypothetical protein